MMRIAHGLPRIINDLFLYISSHQRHLRLPRITIYLLNKADVRVFDSSAKYSDLYSLNLYSSYSVLCKTKAQSVNYVCDSDEHRPQLTPRLLLMPYYHCGNSILLCFDGRYGRAPRSYTHVFMHALIDGLNLFYVRQY